jgi:hypothetical protein
MLQYGVYLAILRPLTWRCSISCWTTPLLDTQHFSQFLPLFGHLGNFKSGFYIKQVQPMKLSQEQEFLTYSKVGILNTLPFKLERTFASWPDQWHPFQRK